MHLGVDGCSDGWVAVWYDDSGYVDSDLYEHIEGLWSTHGDSAETILIDIPIGLRDDSNDKRPCDDVARSRLGRPRGSSVFSVPIRAAVHENSYEDAKSTQESLTDGSLGVQSWGITNKIAQLDTFLRKTEPNATEVIREAHPEICFWALNDENATQYSKTGQPAAAFWERVDILKSFAPNILDHIHDASINLDAKVGNDDVIDAFALALTASPETGPLHILPEEWPKEDSGDSTGLPMEMVYAYRSG